MLRLKPMKIFWSFLIIPAFSFCQQIKSNQITYDHHTYLLYPNLLEELPPIPSPLITKDNTVFVICLTHDDKYSIVPVTVENGEPLNYKNNQWWGKGRQLDVDVSDFPTLAKRGLHSEKELDQTKTITGKSILEITKNGRPNQYSGAGFMGQNENIISVLKGDNRLVNQLGLIHPQLAEPLFHVFNIILTVKKDSQRGNIKGVLYNQREITLKFWGHKGWQESIFNDEILGYWEIELWRDLDEDEKSFLSKKYATLTKDEMSTIMRKLSYIHTGEMVPYYIMRYGFYEGHTDYRADPIAISFIFGLRSLEEIEKSFTGTLYDVLTRHFTEPKIKEEIK